MIATYCLHLSRFLSLPLDQPRSNRFDNFGTLSIIFPEPGYRWLLEYKKCLLIQMETAGLLNHSGDSILPLKPCKLLVLDQRKVRIDFETVRQSQKFLLAFEIICYKVLHYCLSYRDPIRIVHWYLLVSILRNYDFEFDIRYIDYVLR